MFYVTHEGHGYILSADGVTRLDTPDPTGVLAFATR